MIAAPPPPPSLPAPTAAPPQINSIEDVPISVITKAIAEYKSTQAAKVQDADAKEEVTQ